jgi:rhodanese-related sulfurtransferase
MRVLALALCLACAASPLAAQPARNPQIDYAGFLKLTAEVEPYRQERLVDWAEFSRLAKQKDVLVLDARSESAFAQGHIDGAVNLPVTDFTAPRLAEVIGDPDRPILIYCNNNFANDVAPVMLKSRPLALNINTFINLVGYGYRNVYELDEVIDFNDPKVGWVRG